MKKHWIKILMILLSSISVIAQTIPANQAALEFKRPYKIVPDDKDYGSEFQDAVKTKAAQYPSVCMGEDEFLYCRDLQVQHPILTKAAQDNLKNSYGWKELFTGIGIGVLLTETYILSKKL